MKLTIKLLSVVVLLALASPVILLKGCGKAVTGGQCGACPDSTAPQGATITPPTLGGVPSATNGACYPAVAFTVLDKDGAPMNNICVELYTDGASAIAKDTDGTCSSVIANPKTTLITRTNDLGSVVIDFLTPSGVTPGTTFFVQAVSCAVNNTAKTPSAQ